MYVHVCLDVILLINILRYIYIHIYVIYVNIVMSLHPRSQVLA